MISNFYDDNSFDYTRYWEEREYEHFSERIALERLIEYIPQEYRNSIIDVGAGFGRLTKIYAPYFKRCYLIDPSTRLISLAKKRLYRFKKIKFKKGRGEKIPYKKKRFNVALMVRVSHHLKFLSKALNEISRVLPPGGYFIFEYPNKINFKAKTIGAASHKKPKEIFSQKPINLSSKKKGAIPFYNYHPNWVESLVENKAFEIISRLSVSNLRSSFLKKIIPLKTLLFLERILQSFLEKINFGPSIFLLLRKKSDN
ncbi:MAG: class I SAM-dependent methyltransferase [Candidatus Omnitrophica bacterium]|nr:class I SAM-dependent methyltransferase [Candidatus Omnitrophota bacterium]